MHNFITQAIPKQAIPKQVNYAAVMLHLEKCRNLLNTYVMDSC